MSRLEFQLIGSSLNLFKINLCSLEPVNLSLVLIGSSLDHFKIKLCPLEPANSSLLLIGSSLDVFQDLVALWNSRTRVRLLTGSSLHFSKCSFLLWNSRARVRYCELEFATCSETWLLLTWSGSSLQLRKLVRTISPWSEIRFSWFNSFWKDLCVYVPTTPILAPLDL